MMFRSDTGFDFYEGLQLVVRSRASDADVAGIGIINIDATSGPLRKEKMRRKGKRLPCPGKDQKCSLTKVRNYIGYAYTKWRIQFQIKGDSEKKSIARKALSNTAFMTSPLFEVEGF